MRAALRAGSSPAPVPMISAAASFSAQAQDGDGQVAQAGHDAGAVAGADLGAVLSNWPMAGSVRDDGAPLPAHIRVSQIGLITTGNNFADPHQDLAAIIGCHQRTVTASSPPATLASSSVASLVAVAS
jgi:hypothetical protein